MRKTALPRPHSNTRLKEMAVFWIGLCLFAAQQILAAPLPEQGANYCAPNYCSGTIDSGNDTYVCGESLLGPVKLPSCLPLTSLTTTYKRLGDLCPGEFLAIWTEAGKFRYPLADGFANDTSGVPIRANFTLTTGMLLDRFGGPSGTYVSPAGTPYDQRALPPANLNFNISDPTQTPYNYHVYQVKSQILAIGGPITPWFGQPGLGTQFKLQKSVGQLLEEKSLVEVKVEEKCGLLKSSAIGWNWSNIDGRLSLANGLGSEK